MHWHELLIRNIGYDNGILLTLSIAVIGLDCLEVGTGRGGACYYSLMKTWPCFDLWYGHLFWDTINQLVEIIEAASVLLFETCAESVATLLYLYFVSSCSLLFWTDWDDSNPRIERSFLDGSSRKVIVEVQKYSNMPESLPNGITLDYAVNRVYWIDARWEGFCFLIVAGYFLFLLTIFVFGLEHSLILLLLMVVFKVWVYSHCQIWWVWA